MSPWPWSWAGWYVSPPANAGGTSQDLKTGYLVGATPRYQQLALFIGVIVSAIAVGFTIKILDTPSPDLVAHGIKHAIGSTYTAPQATLMATLIKGILSKNLDWNFVLVGAFLALVMELCGVRSLSFAIGVYLPLVYYPAHLSWGCDPRSGGQVKKKKRRDGRRRRRGPGEGQPYLPPVWWQVGR
jgi:uncharacterized oligopeptide transporter (OPT) family protein